MKALSGFACVWLIIMLLVPTAGAASPSSTITVLVDNYSQASPSILAGAEGEAGRILGQAGVRVVWQECPVEPATISLQGPCQKATEATDIKLRIVPVLIHGSIQDSIFGFTVHPVLATVYYQYAVRLAKRDDAEFEVPIILGCVIAHEIGHLLLGPNGHSAGGIMQPQWEREQIRQLMMGILLFTSQQAKSIRAEARRRMGLQAETVTKQPMLTVDQ